MGRRVDGMRSKTPGRTFVDVHLAVVRRVEDLERALEALRLEQELEVGSPHVRRKDTTVSFVWTA